MLDIECFSFLNRALEAPLRIPLDVKLLFVLAEFHGMMQNWVETSSLHDLSISAQSHICDVGW